MDRYWLLTWTTFGTWLPGDQRGFVGRERAADGRQSWLNVPGTPARTETPNSSESLVLAGAEPPCG